MAAQPAIAPLRCLRSLALTPSPPPTTRLLSTTAALSRQTPSHRTVPADQVPDYPYGRFETYKQRNEGLYGRAKIRFGNVVAPKYKNKSRTSWLPNRHRKRLWSPALGAFIRTRMTASVLHTIDRLGGIDEYLLGSKAKRIKELGPAGWALRWKIIQTDAVQARFARERAALGLPPKSTATTTDSADADVDADAAAAASAFPAELAAEGLTAEKVDAMLQQEDEFVIGDPLTEAEMEAETEAEVEAEAETAAEAEAETAAEAEAETAAEAEAEAEDTTAPTVERPDAAQQVQKPE